MGSVENPSADKFGPPAGSEERFSAPQPRATARRLTRVALGLVVLRMALDSYERRLGHSILFASALFAIMIAEWVIYFKRRDAAEDSPFSTGPRITR